MHHIHIHIKPQNKHEPVIAQIETLIFTEKTNNKSVAVVFLRTQAKKKCDIEYRDQYFVKYFQCYIKYVLKLVDKWLFA